MQQFTVPQFIDVEDKIIGPITVRQFVIMLTCFMFIAVYYRFFDFSLFVVSSLVTLGAFGVVAFFKVSGMPFHYFILNFVQTSARAKVRVWSNVIGRIDSGFDAEDVEHTKEVVHEQARTFSGSRLAELSLIVDTQGSYRGKEEGEKVRYNSKTAAK